jgi:hypothetical protein
MMSTSKEYRQMAADAYRMAEAATSDRVREKLLEVAKSWEHVAKQAERAEAERSDSAA